jgi:hypothetical protein
LVVDDVAGWLAGWLAVAVPYRKEEYVVISNKASVRMYKALVKKEQRITQINMKQVKKGFRVRYPAPDALPHNLCRGDVVVVSLTRMRSNVLLSLHTCSTWRPSS